MKTYKKQGGFTVFAVKANELGLNPHQQKKLFYLFSRMHKHVEGTGVGLFRVRRLGDNKGGRIEIESEEGKGTSFKAYLKN